MARDLLYDPSPGVLGADGFVHIPIRVTGYLNEPAYNPSLLQKLRNKVASGEDQNPRRVSMSRDNYITYWAEDDEGKLLSDVRDPSQERVEWLRYQLRSNYQW